MAILTHAEKDRVETSAFPGEGVGGEGGGAVWYSGTKRVAAAAAVSRLRFSRAAFDSDEDSGT